MQSLAALGPCVDRRVQVGGDGCHLPPWRVDSNDERHDAAAVAVEEPRGQQTGRRRCGQTTCPGADERAMHRGCPWPGKSCAVAVVVEEPRGQQTGRRHCGQTTCPGADERAMHRGRPWPGTSCAVAVGAEAAEVHPPAATHHYPIPLMECGAVDQATRPCVRGRRSTGRST